jgi:hypothetical protein
MSCDEKISCLHRAAWPWHDGSFILLKLAVGEKDLCPSSSCRSSRGPSEKSSQTRKLFLARYSMVFAAKCVWSIVILHSSYLCMFLGDVRLPGYILSNLSESTQSSSFRDLSIWEYGLTIGILFVFPTDLEQLIQDCVMSNRMYQLETDYECWFLWETVGTLLFHYALNSKVEKQVPFLLLVWQN